MDGEATYQNQRLYIDPTSLPFWVTDKFTEGKSIREQTFVCQSANKIYLQNLTLASLESLNQKVINPMNGELGFSTIHYRETKDHVNLRCVKDCLFSL